MCWCPLTLGLCLCWELRVSIQFLLLLCYLKMSVIKCFWSLVVSQEHTNNTHKIPITQIDFCVSFAKEIFQLKIPTSQNVILQFKHHCGLGQDCSNYFMGFQNITSYYHDYYCVNTTKQVCHQTNVPAV